ncbi:hypothetical protein ACQP2F_12450 [Actinoplanes sp. CA-030573]|uniref:hypothetical protein n=1 Tax=Actinoplanes sp. CA-030573 TaxID=3239898 RepID=UPI003D89E51B
MADPLTLAAVGALALTEGVKFLYSQAGEALKAWRESRRSGRTSTEVEIKAPDVFAQAPSRAEIDFEAVERLERELREFRAAFADVHDDIDEIDEKDAATLERVEGLRRAMEAIYHQPLVFKREPGSAAARGEVDVDEVLGYAAGLRARKVLGGTVTGIVRAGRVEREGRVVGVEIDEVG